MNNKARVLTIISALVSGVLVLGAPNMAPPVSAAAVESNGLFKIESVESETTPIGCIGCSPYKTNIPVFSTQSDIGSSVAAATKIDTFNSSAWDPATSQQKTFKGGCALVGGGMKCWGDNSRGQLGDETTTSSVDTPVVAKENGVALTGITDVSTNGVTTCIVASGVLKCIGAGNWEGNTSARYTFSEVPRNWNATNNTYTDGSWTSRYRLTIYNAAGSTLYTREDSNWNPETMVSKTWATVTSLGSNVQKVQVGAAVSNQSTPTICALLTTGVAKCAKVTEGTTSTISDDLTKQRWEVDCDGLTTPDGVLYEKLNSDHCDNSELGGRTAYTARYVSYTGTRTAAATWSWVDAGVTNAVDIAMPADSWGASTLCFAGPTTVCRPFSAGEFGKATTIENGENSQAVYITSGWGPSGLCLYSNDTISCGSGTSGPSGMTFATKVTPVAVMAKPLNIFFGTTSSMQKLYFLVPSGVLSADGWIFTCTTCGSTTSNVVSPVTGFSSSTSTEFTYAQSVNGSTDSADFIPMTVVSGSRKMRSSVALSVKTASGEALTGVSIRWTAPDAPGTLTSSASSTLASDGTGAARSTLPSGPVTFTLSPPSTSTVCCMGPTPTTSTTTTTLAGSPPTTGGTLASGASLQAASITVLVGDTGTVTITVPDPPTVVKRKVTVELPDGTPVPGATVQFKNTYLTYAYQNSGGSTSSWSSRAKDAKGYIAQMTCAYCFVASPRYATGSDGSVTIQSFNPSSRSSAYDADVAYDDGELNQNVKAKFTSLADTVRMPFMASIKAAMPDADPSTPAKDADADPSTPETDLKPDSNGAVSIETSLEDEDKAPISGQPESIETVNSGCDSGGLVSTTTKADSVCTEGTVSTASLGRAVSVRASGVRSTAGCTPTLSTATNAAGKATLTVCPVASTKYRIRGKGAIASRTFCVMVNGVKCGGTTQNISTGSPTSGYTPTSSSTTGSVTKVKRSSRTALSKLLAPAKGSTATYSSSSKCKVSGKYLLASKTAATCTLSMLQSTRKKVKGKWVIQKTRKSVRIQVI